MSTSFQQYVNVSFIPPLGYSLITSPSAVARTNNKDVCVYTRERERQTDRQKQRKMCQRNKYAALMLYLNCTKFTF